MSMSPPQSSEEQSCLPTQPQEPLSADFLPISSSPASTHSKHIQTATEGHLVNQSFSLHNLLNIFTGGVEGGSSSFSNISPQGLRHVSNTQYGLHSLAEVHRFGLAPSCGGRSHDLTSCPLTREHLVQHRKTHLQNPSGNTNSQQQHVQRALFTEQNTDDDSRPVLTALLGGMPLNASLLASEGGGTSLPAVEEEVSLVSPLRVSRVLTSVEDLHQLSSGVHSKLRTSTSSLWNQSLNRNANTTSTPRTIQHNQTNNYHYGHTNDTDNQKPETRSSGQETALQHEGQVHMIPVPVSVNEDGPVDQWRKVYQYPTEAVTTVVERRSYLEPDSETSSVSSFVDGPDDGRSSATKRRRNRRRRGGSEGRLQGSVSPSELSRALNWDAASNVSSNISNAGSSFSLNTTVSGSRLSLLPLNHSKDLVHSNASSCASNISDLSSYETEYIRIKQLISESPGSLVNVNDLGVKSKKPWPTIAEIHDFESAVKDLTTQKEDLEIQVHRLSSQLQNAIKEKEMCQERLETTKANVTDVNQRQMFEVLKEKADLEGRLELEVKKRTDTVDELKILKDAMTDVVNEKELYELKCNDLSRNEENNSLKIVSLQKELQCSILSVNEVKQSNVTLETKNIELDRLLNEKTRKDLQCEEQLEMLMRSMSAKCNEVATLSSAVDRLNQQVKTQQMEKLNHVAENEKLTTDMESVTKWQSWLKEQLDLAQDARQALQDQLKETREKVIELTAQRNANADDAQNLRVELDETRSRAVRERNSLMLKLQTLQEDLSGYEEQIKKHQNQGQEGNSEETQLHEKVATLQKDCKNSRLRLIDAERCIEGMEEKISHKCVQVKKYESELRELRQAAVVNGELVVENNIRLDALINQINEKNMIISNLKKDLIKKENSLKSIREEKMQVDIKLSGTLSEKLEVDQATFKVKEDINKLSSSLFRMKHDLTTRDREIIRHKEEINALHQAKLALEAQVKSFQDTSAPEPRVQTGRELIKIKNNDNKLVEQLRREAEAKKLTEAELSDATSKLGVLELETKSLSEGVQLRDDEIQSLQQSLQEYGELVTKKDEEMEKAEALRRVKEGECSEWNRKVKELSKDGKKMQEKLTEKSAEIEKCKGEIRSLRDSLHKEYKLKNAIEKKIELNNVQFSKERANLMLETSSMKKKLQVTEGDLRDTIQECSKVNNSLEEREKEVKNLREALEARTQSVLDLEGKLITIEENHARESEPMIVEEHSVVRKVACEELTSQKSANEPYSAEASPSDKLVDHAHLLNNKNMEMQAERDSNKKEKVCLQRAIESLTNDVESLRVQCSSLTDTNSLLESRVRDCEVTREEAVQSLSRVREALKSVTEERDQWQASYQSLQELVDTIPQRDTDSCFSRVAVGSATPPAATAAAAVIPAVVGAVADGVDSIDGPSSRVMADPSGGGGSNNLPGLGCGTTLASTGTAPGSEGASIGQPDLARNLSELQQKMILISEVLNTKEQKLSSVCLQLNEQDRKMKKLHDEVAESRGLMHSEKMLKEAAKQRLHEEIAKNETLSANLCKLADAKKKSCQNDRVDGGLIDSCYMVQTDPQQLAEGGDDQQQMLQWSSSSADIEQLTSNVSKLTSENESYKLRMEQQQSIIERLNTPVSEGQNEQSELNKVSAEAERLQGLLSSCECQRNESMKKIIESECSKTDFMKQVSELKHRNSALGEQVSKLERKTSEQTHKINEVTKFGNETNTKLNERDRVCKDLRGQFMALESEKNNLIHQADKLLNHNKDLVEQLTSTKFACKDHLKQLNEAETRCNDMKEQLSKTGSLVKDLTGKLSVANINNSDLSQRSQEMQKDKETLVKNLAQLESKYETSQKKLSEVESELEVLLKQASESESKQNVLQEKISEVQSASVVLQKQLTESTSKQRRCESNVNLLTRKLREHLKGRKDAEAETARLRQRVEEAEEAGTREVAAIKERLLTTEDALEAAVAATCSSDARAREAQLEQKQLQEALQQRQQELLVLRQRLAAAEETEAIKLRLEKEVVEAASQLKTLQTERATLKSDLTSLRDQLSAEGRVKEELGARVTQLEVVETEVPLLRSSLSKLTDELATVVTERDLSKKQEEELNAEVLELKTAVQKLEDQLRQASDKTTELEEELDRVRRRENDERMKYERLASEEQEKRTVLDKQLEMRTMEVDRSQAAMASATAECERLEKEGNEAVANARQETLSSRQKVSELEEQASSLTSRLERNERELKVAVSERQTALTTNAQLRTALDESLQQIRVAMSSSKLMASPDDGEVTSSAVSGRAMPPTPPLSTLSPAPLDTEALQALLERAQAVDSGNLEPLSTLQGSLATFKQELCLLQDAVHRSTQRYLSEPTAESDVAKPSNSEGS